MLRIARIVLIVVALFLGMMFAALNFESVPFDYFFGKQYIPLVALLILDLLVGLAIGVVVYVPQLFSLRIELQRTRKKLASAESELRELRNLPIRDA